MAINTCHVHSLYTRINPYGFASARTPTHKTAYVPLEVEVLFFLFIYFFFPSHTFYQIKSRKFNALKTRGTTRRFALKYALRTLCKTRRAESACARTIRATPRFVQGVPSENLPVAISLRQTEIFKWTTNVSP